MEFEAASIEIVQEENEEVEVTDERDHEHAQEPDKSKKSDSHGSIDFSSLHPSTNQQYVNDLNLIDFAPIPHDYSTQLEKSTEDFGNEEKNDNEFAAVDANILGHNPAIATVAFTDNDTPRPSVSNTYDPPSSTSSTLMTKPPISMLEPLPSAPPLPPDTPTTPPQETTSTLIKEKHMKSVPTLVKGASVHVDDPLSSNISPVTEDAATHFMIELLGCKSTKQLEAIAVLIATAKGNGYIAEADLIELRKVYTQQTAVLTYTAVSFQPTAQKNHTAQKNDSAQKNHTAIHINVGVTSVNASVGTKIPNKQKRYSTRGKGPTSTTETETSSLLPKNTVNNTTNTHGRVHMRLHATGPDAIALEGPKQEAPNTYRSWHWGALIISLFVWLSIAGLIVCVPATAANECNDWSCDDSGTGQECAGPSSNIVIASSVFLGVFGLVYLINSCCMSATAKYVCLPRKDIPGVVQHVANLKRKKGWLGHRVKCWHKETRTSTSYDSSTKTYVTTTYEVDVNTFNQPFQCTFDTCIDKSDGLPQWIADYNLVRLKAAQLYILPDNHTKTVYANHGIRLNTEHKHRDVYIAVTREFNIGGFQSHVLCRTSLTNDCANCFLSPCTMMLCVMLLLTWPYRLWLEYYSMKLEMKFKKQFQSRK